LIEHCNQVEIWFYTWTVVWILRYSQICYTYSRSKVMAKLIQILVYAKASIKFRWWRGKLPTRLIATTGQTLSQFPQYMHLFLSTIQEPLSWFLIVKLPVLKMNRQSTGHQNEQSWQAIHRKVPTELSTRQCQRLVTDDDTPAPVTSPNRVMSHRARHCIMRVKLLNKWIPKGNEVELWRLPQLLALASCRIMSVLIPH